MQDRFLRQTASRWSLLTAVCLLFVGNPVVRGADLVDVEPLEPEVMPASDEAVQAMAGIRIPDGWKIGLFAAEPDVANIVAFDIDHRGRIYVCESFRQNRGVTDNRAHDEKWLLADLASETVQDRIEYHKKLLGDAAITYAQHDDRIRRLVDSNGDGIADQSDVIAKGFNRLEEGTGAGVLVRGNDIYYTCIPKLWKLVDQDGDGNVDDRVVLSDGFGVRVAFRGHDMHGLLLGVDGRLYFSIGDRGYHVTTAEGRVLADPTSGAVFRCELDGTELEVYAQGLRNPQELAFNDLGDLFTVDNNSDSGDRARIVHLLEGGDSGWRMHYQYLPDRGPFNRERIWEPYHLEQPAYMVPPIANFTDGPSGLTFYPGSGFGDTLKNKFLICDFRGGPTESGIRSFQLQPDGAFYKLGEDDQPIWNCLATDVAFGPDGALYVSDWVNGWDGLGKGRIYRLYDPEHADSDVVKEVAKLLDSDWSDRSTDQLAKDLAHPDRRVRLEAQWQLAERSEHPTLLDVARSGEQSQVSRLHAIWGVDQIARLDQDTAPAILASLRSLLDDEDAVVRAAVVKVLGERVDLDSTPQIRKLLQDPSARVRYFTALSLARLKDAESLGAVVAMLAKNDNQDPALRHAGIIYLALAVKAGDVAKLSSHANVSVRRAAVAALRRSASGELMAFLNDSDPLVVTEAARAIHDTPVAVAMPALAAMIKQDFSAKEYKPSEPPANVPVDTPLARRVLNANFRLGSVEAATELAAFATRLSAPASLRVEALEMLSSWAAPDPRDRVLNAYRPLKPRTVKAAAEALEPQIDLLSNAEEVVREKMIDVASGLGIKKIVPMLAQRVVDTNLRDDLRAQALTALARLDPPAAVKLAKQGSISPSTKMVPAALNVLAAHAKSESMETFLAATKSDNKQLRQLGWDILAGVDHPAAIARINDGVQKYIAGELPADVQLNVLEAAAGKLQQDVASSLSSYQSKLAETEPLAKWLPALQGGDVATGAKLFSGKTELSCIRCHKVDRAGGEVGPNLTTIGKQRDRRYLLESICLPNAQIAKGFETAVIADASGDIVTGVVKTETDDFVELIQADGSLKRIAQDEIELRKRGQSSMPADLIKLMTARELCDLVAYLASLQVDPRAADDVE